MSRLARALALALCASCSAPARAGWELSGDSWRTDPAWHDGRAEKCVYEATLTVYGVERAYVATAYTDRERLDPRTRAKAHEGEPGVEVYKHHWSERVPTERYDYDYATTCYLAASDLAPLQLTAATQDDCGASFKQVWCADGELTWLESVYYPGGGLRTGRYATPTQLALEDGLTLLLRDYPFARGGERTLALLPSQKSPRRASFEPVLVRVRYGGRETLTLPAGAIDAHRLEIRDAAGALLAEHWYAAESSAPWLHALVQSKARDGASYRLRSIERVAYWERAP